MDDAREKMLLDRIKAVEDKADTQDAQIAAMHNFFFSKAPGDPDGLTRSRRIMDVVDNAERSRWVVFWVVRIICTLGAMAGAITVLLAFQGGA